MPTMIFYVIGVMLLIYGAYFYFYINKKKKLANAFDNLDMNTEMARANGYVSELLNKDYRFITSQLKDTPVDAFISATTEYTSKDVAKDTAKDLLKSAATLGTVKFRTVQTPKFLVLSGDDLHLLDTDTDGNISNHLVFDKFRLQDSSIEEDPAQHTLQKQMQAGGIKDMKRYKLNLAADGGAIPLVVYDFIIADPNNSAMAAFTSGADSLVKNRVAAKYFLKKLGELSPNLKTS